MITVRIEVEATRYESRDGAEHATIFPIPEDEKGNKFYMDFGNWGYPVADHGAALLRLHCLGINQCAGTRTIIVEG